MRKLHDVLRLKAAGLPQRAIAQACGIGLGTVTAYLQRGRRSGLAAR
jgi:DNA-directed RNA polymerase specialized sigma24 family protein